MVDVVCGPVGLLLIMTGHERTSARVVAVTTALNVALNAALIPAFGGVGAASATACSIVVRNLVLVVTARRRLHLDSTALGHQRRSTPDGAAT
jgi:O-antigen/teichoic acid export membrane protein